MSRPRPHERYEDDEGPRRPRDPVSSLIPYHNPKSLVAYYCGVFGLIPCAGLVLAPLALTFGIMALGHLRRYPDAGGGGHAITGIVLGSLSGLAHLIVLVFILIGILTAR